MTFCFSDFAIRNCLLASDLTVKIGDYGMSEETFKVPDFWKRIFNRSIYCGVYAEMLSLLFLMDIVGRLLL